MIGSEEGGLTRLSCISTGCFGHFGPVSRPIQLMLHFLFVVLGERMLPADKVVS